MDPILQPDNARPFYKNKKVLLGIFVGIILISIPLGVYLVQKQQIFKSRAGGGSILVQDSFDRADGLNLGSTETGQNWQIIGGSFGISNNTLYPVNGCPAPGYAVVDAGNRNKTLEVTATVNKQDLLIPFNLIDVNNLYQLANGGSSYKLEKKLNGVTSSLGETNGITPANQDRITITTYNGDIKVFINGTQLIQATDFAISGTKFGVGTWCNGQLRFDDFKIYSDTTPGTNIADIDVTYIERTPRYSKYCVYYSNDLPLLCPGTENEKRWPDVGQQVTYKAHIKNKGGTSSPAFRYQWNVNNTFAASGTLLSLSYDQETTISLVIPFTATPQTIQFTADPDNQVTEHSKVNNSLTIGSKDLTLSYWAEKGSYDSFNSTVNMKGTYSFEDWVQAHISKMNERLSQAKYPVSPNGVTDQVRIDKIVIADQLDGQSSPMNNDPDLFLIDGRWQNRDNDPTNQNGINGAWRNYANEFAAHIDFGLIHEMTHQIGVIDEYRMNIANDPANNNRIQVKDINGQVINTNSLPNYGYGQILFEYQGLMGGGNTSPYRDVTYYSDFTAGALNSNSNFRRGYFGEYLFDTPNQISLLFLDKNLDPLPNATVSLYQRDALTEAFDNTPEITATTDANGKIYLPNRPVSGITTATNHTLKPNPFGQINVNGTNGTFLVVATKGGYQDYNWLLLSDVNLSYWQGNKTSATFTYQTKLDNLPIGPTATPNPTVSLTPTVVPSLTATPTPTQPVPTTTKSVNTISVNGKPFIDLTGQASQKFTIQQGSSDLTLDINVVYSNQQFETFPLKIKYTGSLITPLPLPTFTVTPTPTTRITPTITTTPNPTPTYSPTITPSPTPTVTLAPTATPSLISTPTIIPTISLSPTIDPPISYIILTEPKNFTDLGLSISGQPLGFTLKEESSTNSNLVKILYGKNNVQVNSFYIKFNYTPKATPTPKSPLVKLTVDKDQIVSDHRNIQISWTDDSRLGGGTSYIVYRKRSTETQYYVDQTTTENKAELNTGYDYPITLRVFACVVTDCEVSNEVNLPALEAPAPEPTQGSELPRQIILSYNGNDTILEAAQNRQASIRLDGPLDKEHESTLILIAKYGIQPLETSRTIPIKIIYRPKTTPQITTPINLKVRCNPNNQTATLSWTPVSTTDIYYQLRINKDPLSTWAPANPASGDEVPKLYPQSTSFDNSYTTSVKDNTKNSFSVQAVPNGKVSNSSSQSEYYDPTATRSDEYAFRCSSNNTTLDQPRNISVSCTQGNLNLSWDRVNNEEVLKHHVRGKLTDDGYFTAGDDWTNNIPLGDIISNNAGDNISCDNNRCSYSESGIKTGNYKIWVDSYAPNTNPLTISNDVYISGLVSCQ